MLIGGSRRAAVPPPHPIFNLAEQLRCRDTLPKPVPTSSPDELPSYPLTCFDVMKLAGFQSTKYNHTVQRLSGLLNHLYLPRL